MSYRRADLDHLPWNNLSRIAAVAVARDHLSTIVRPSLMTIQGQGSADMIDCLVMLAIWQYDCSLAQGWEVQT